MGIFSKRRKKEDEEVRKEIKEVKKVASIKDDKKKIIKKDTGKIKKDMKRKEKDIKKDTEKREDINIKKSFSHLEYIIRNPHITEKSSDLISLGQYTFKVANNANKEEIKKAVEKIYNVKVDKVRVIIIPSKKRMMGRKIGKKSGYKKAIVKLKEGYSIEIIPGAGKEVEKK